MAVQLRNKAASEESERAEIKRLVLRANRDLDLAGLAGTPRAGTGRPAAASKSGDGALTMPHVPPGSSSYHLLCAIQKKIGGSLRPST